MLSFIILIFLIVLNGLFVMAEIALVSARKSKLEDMSAKGDHQARAALKLAEKPESFLSTAQIGITLVAILTGFYSGEKFGSYLKPYIEMIPQLKRYSNSISTTIVIIIVTFLTIIFGELIPKGLA